MQFGDTRVRNWIVLINFLYRAQNVNSAFSKLLIFVVSVCGSLYLVCELSYHRLGLNLLALSVYPVPVTTFDPFMIIGPSPSASAARADCLGFY